ncbi:hypothetical protein ZIOFF_000569 [Zingiber officinale]|uniref:RING-type E3 ubiquitin transferase n=1 Tax=Zingiber officinale TaxID=94328 RepID=A0A8J5M7L0_ZINOF|nr:hypothetical protein ZIOFF_000569 [Zingiber officinale]
MSVLCIHVLSLSELLSICGLNSEAYNNSPSATIHPSLPNFNLEVPCYAAAHTGIAQQPFIHSWSCCGSFQCQPYYAGRSSHAVSTELSEPTQPADPHCLPWEPISMISYHRRNIPFSYAEDPRNIRMANISTEINQLHRHHVRNITREIDGHNNFCLVPNHKIMQNVNYGAVVGSEANLGGMSLRVPPKGQDMYLGLPDRASPCQGATPDMVFLGQMILAPTDWISIGPLNCVDRSESIQPAAIMDQSTFYDPRSLFDEHHEMRLDIDNKNYGKHTTEVLKDWISTRKDTVSYESYKHGERLGRLKCGHGFHACCIKQWLLIKDICPVCKALALEDS